MALHTWYMHVAVHALVYIDEGSRLAFLEVMG